VPGCNCWRIEACEAASVVIDAADYYHLIHRAMSAARSCILVTGWDFDTRVDLEPEDGPGGQTLGRFFLDLARRDPSRRSTRVSSEDHNQVGGFGAKRSSAA